MSLPGFPTAGPVACPSPLPTTSPAQPTFPPTDEQRNIIKIFNAGVPLVVIAAAGSGKTTTLGLLANEMAKTGRQGIYITLNRDMAKDVGSKFVHGNISASTIHSLAWRIAERIEQVAPLLEKIRRETAPVSQFHWHRVIGITTIFRYTSFHAANVRLRGEQSSDTTINSQALCWAALDALRLWCQSDREDLDIEDVERPVTMPYEVYRDEYAPLVMGIARRAWVEDILHPDGKLPFTHDYYLKLVTLAKPQLTQWLDLPPNSVLFFDEAQDSRPCVTYLLSLQTDMQIVAVGDPSQAIYAFTGARDGLPKIQAMSNAKTATLTTSFRFGHPIAEVANRVLDILHAPIRVRGDNAKQSTVAVIDKDTRPDMRNVDAVLVHTNAQLLATAEYCMQDGVQYQIMTDTGMIHAVARDFDRLESGEKATSTELRDFNSIQELVDYVESEDSHTSGGRSLTFALVRWIMAHSTAEARFIIDNAVQPGEEVDGHRVTLSTAHKSKGRQWDRVWVNLVPEQSLPFFSPLLDPEVSNGELVDLPSRQNVMLAYVAVTRAKKTLYLTDDLVKSFDMITDSISNVGDMEACAAESKYGTPQPVPAFPMAPM